MRLEDTEVDFSPTFSLMLTTRDNTCQFSPDVCSRVTFVNFIVTPASLQSQCLNKVCPVPQPSLPQWCLPHSLSRSLSFISSLLFSRSFSFAPVLSLHHSLCPSLVCSTMTLSLSLFAAWLSIVEHFTALCVCVCAGVEGLSPPSGREAIQLVEVAGRVSGQLVPLTLLSVSLWHHWLPVVLFNAGVALSGLIGAFA